MYHNERSEEEIDDLLNECADAENDGTSKFPGMTYEQGILMAVNWLVNKDAPHPLED